MGRIFFNKMVVKHSLRTLCFVSGFAFLTNASVAQTARPATSRPATTRPAQRPVAKQPAPQQVGRIKAQSSITDHTKAYKPRPGRGEHIDIKVTPPELRGQKGMVLVEVYNNSNFNIDVLKFDLEVLSRSWYKIESQVVVEDMVPQWSDARWIKIPEDGKLPIFDSVQIKNVEIFSNNATPIKLPVYSDLIKK